MTNSADPDQTYPELTNQTKIIKKNQQFGHRMKTDRTGYMPRLI